MLYRIYSQRGKLRAVIEREYMVEFLSYCYLLTSDVRFFNELLWQCSVVGTATEKYVSTANSHFYDSVSGDGFHKVPQTSREFVIRTIAETRRRVPELNPAHMKGVRVALLGRPTLFPNLYRRLNNSGCFVRCLMIQHHSNPFVSLALRNRFLYTLIAKTIKNTPPFARVRMDEAAIKTLIKNQEFDIGFQKLGFIINKELIEAFRVGIINDHWGALPFVRGRSSVEYSLLFGFPIVATTHLVTSDIDCGEIISCFDYSREIAGIRKISRIRKMVRSAWESRAYTSIALLSQGRKILQENSVALGRTYYLIHPALTDFIEREILPRDPC